MLFILTYQKHLGKTHTYKLASVPSQIKKFIPHFAWKLAAISVSASDKTALYKCSPFSMMSLTRAGFPHLISSNQFRSSSVAEMKDFGLPNLKCEIKSIHNLNFNLIF